MPCGDGNCELCCQPLGWFGSVEYNLWWTKTRSVPPLATTSLVNPATPINEIGVLPNAQILFGGGREGADPGNGGRVAIGRWLDSEQTFALGANFWAFAGDTAGGVFTSDTSPNLAIPFFDAQAGNEDAYLVSYTPDGTVFLARGAVNVEDRLDMVGGEAYGQILLYEEMGTRFDLLGGYRLLRIDNSLSIGSDLVSLSNAFLPPVGTRVAINDLFQAENEFNGGVLGISSTTYCDRWTFFALAKMSLGNMRQAISIDGLTVITAPNGATDVRDEGLFALGTNQGTYSDDRFVYIPEASLKLSYALLPNIDVSIGYTFMYISSVALAGDQVDRNLNLSQTNGGPAQGPNQNRPMFLPSQETDFWMQGLNFGLEWRF
jgi:hypothetical protein